MNISISLSESDLECIKNVLGITDYNGIHTSIIETYAKYLDKVENFVISDWFKKED